MVGDRRHSPGLYRPAGLMDELERETERTGL